MKRPVSSRFRLMALWLALLWLPGLSLAQTIVNVGNSANPEGIVYSAGGWFNTRTGDINNDERFLNNSSSYVQYTFTGTGVDVIGFKPGGSQYAANYTITVDGTTVATGNTTSATSQFQLVFGSATGLPNASHTVRISFTSGIGANAYVIVDAFRIYAGTPVPVTGVTVAPATATVASAATQQLTATIAPANATNQEVTWSSSAPAVATVSAAGLVTGVAVGSATITATTADGGFTATSAITVTTAPSVNVTGVTVSPTATSVNAGGTVQLTPTVLPANATNKNVTWSSSAPAVAAVNAAGLVTGVTAGSATITVTTQQGGFTASSVLTVNTVGSLKVLIFSKTTAFRHASIPFELPVIKAFLTANNVQWDATEDAGLFTDANLAQYNACIFLHTTGSTVQEPLNSTQQGAFMRFIQSGKGLVALHAASDAGSTWPWLTQLIGARFRTHPLGSASDYTANLRVVDGHASPSTSVLPDLVTDLGEEYYFFDVNPVDTGCQILATLDFGSFDDKGIPGVPPRYHPWMWQHEFDGGRCWFTASGHYDFDRPLILNAMLGGLYWVTKTTDRTLPAPPPEAYSSSNSDPNNVHPNDAVNGYDPADDAVSGGAWTPVNGVPQWIYLDQRYARPFNGLTVKYRSATVRPQSYIVQKSNDAITWTDVVTVTSNGTNLDDLSFAIQQSRYVRIYITANTSSQYAPTITDLKLKNTGQWLGWIQANQPAENLALGKTTVPASASKMVDGIKNYSQTTNFSSGDGSFYVDLGVAQTVGRAVLTQVPGHSSSLHQKIEYSNDATNWTVIRDADSLYLFEPQEFIFPPVTGRYFRFTYTVPFTNEGIIQEEIELYRPGSSTDNLLVGKPVTVTNGGSSSAANINDGDYQTYWQSTSHAPSFVFDLESVQPINRIRCIGDTHYDLLDSRVSVSTDNSNWTVVSPAATPTSDLYHALSIPVAFARYVKFEILRTHYDTGSFVREFQVYGPVGTASSTVIPDPTVYPATGVSVNPSSTTVNVGEDTQLLPVVLPANATNKTVIWASSNVAVATVSAVGVVVVVAVGNAVVTVTTEDGGFTGTSTITVLPAGTIVNVVNIGNPTDGMTYSGTSAFQTRTGSVANDETLLTGNASSCQYTFTGTRVDVIGYKPIGSGANYSVSVDGGTPVTGNTASASAQLQQIFASVDNLPSGSHTVNIQAVGPPSTITNKALNKTIYTSQYYTSTARAVDGNLTNEVVNQNTCGLNNSGKLGIDLGGTSNIKSIVMTFGDTFPGYTISGSNDQTNYTVLTTSSASTSGTVTLNYSEAYYRYVLVSSNSFPAGGFYYSPHIREIAVNCLNAPLLHLDALRLYATPTPFAAWQTANFTAAELQNPAISGPEASALNDGVSNLIKFASNIPAKQPAPTLTPGTGTSGLPAGTRQDFGGGPQLVFEFLRRRATTNPGITYTSRFSPDLSAWNAAIVTIDVTTIDAIWERVRVRETSTPPLPTRRFAQLLITQP